MNEELGLTLLKYCVKQEKLVSVGGKQEFAGVITNEFDQVNGADRCFIARDEGSCDRGSVGRSNCGWSKAGRRARGIENEKTTCPVERYTNRKHEFHRRFRFAPFA
jgi:hypothetical protein